MTDALRQRVIIVGNSGSGKSTLACKIGDVFCIPVFHLDSFHWEDEEYGRKRDEETALQMVRHVTSAPRWIIEGVYGWLAQPAVEQATALIWLDLPWSECRDGLLERHGANAAAFADLLAWTEAYWVRQTSSSFAGHLSLYEAFMRHKLRLCGRNEVVEFSLGIDGQG